MKCILFCPLAVNRNPLESLRNIVNAVSDRKCIQYDKTNVNAHEQVLVSYWVLSFCFDIIWGFSIQWCTHNAHGWSDITESHSSFMNCTTGWKLKPRLHCHIPIIHHMNAEQTERSGGTDVTHHPWREAGRHARLGRYLRLRVSIGW